MVCRFFFKPQNTGLSIPIAISNKENIREHFSKNETKFLQTHKNEYKKKHFSLVTFLYMR